MNRNTLFMETTKIPASRSAAEICECLIAAGARSINTDYGPEGQITSIAWMMRVHGGELRFKMPARVDPVHAKLVTEAKRTNRYTGKRKDEIKEKAGRIAWRQLLRWVQAQLAMIDFGMSEMSEVFFPYVETPSGQTLFEIAKNSQFKMLSSGDKPQ